MFSLNHQETNRKTFEKNTEMVSTNIINIKSLKHLWMTKEKNHQHLLMSNSIIIKQGNFRIWYSLYIEDHLPWSFTNKMSREEVCCWIWIGFSQQDSYKYCLFIIHNTCIYICVCPLKLSKFFVRQQNKSVKEKQNFYFQQSLLVDFDFATIPSNQCVYSMYFSSLLFSFLSSSFQMKIEEEKAVLFFVKCMWVYMEWNIPELLHFNMRFTWLLNQVWFVQNL